MHHQHKLVVGCGYLGRRVADAWLAEGHTVSAVTRSADRAAEFSRDGIRPIIGDICNPETLAGLPNADTILFAVGYDRTSGKSQADVYVSGLKNVLEKVAARTRRLIYISSSSVYGQSAGEWVDETSDCHPSQPGGTCCLAAEEVLHTFFGGRSNNCQSSANILRLSGIYGPGRLLARTESLRAGETIAGRPDAWLNLIHVDDAVLAVQACEERGCPARTYLVTDDRPIPREVYYELLARLVGAPAPKFSQEESPRRGSGGLNKRCSNRRLHQELGVTLRYPTINEGLIQALSAPAGRELAPKATAGE